MASQLRWKEIITVSLENLLKNGYLDRLTAAASRRFVLQSEEAPIHVTLNLNISCDQGQTQPTGDKR